MVVGKGYGDGEQITTEPDRELAYNGKEVRIELREGQGRHTYSNQEGPA